MIYKILKLLEKQQLIMFILLTLFLSEILSEELTFGYREILIVAGLCYNFFVIQLFVYWIYLSIYLFILFFFCLWFFLFVCLFETVK